MVICFEADSADEIWRQAARELRGVREVQEGRDQRTRELLHVAFTIRDPRQRLVYARKINPAFAVAEVLWILAGLNDVDFLRFWNPRMSRWSDQDGRLYGAYGFRLGSRPRLCGDADDRLRGFGVSAETPLDQVRGVYEALRYLPHTRQAVLQIWDSKRDLPDPSPRSEDVPCNLVSHLMIRSGKLEWLQVMRSNDLFWGTPYNLIQFTCLQEIMAGWLGVEVGTYTHISDSLHVYERHWDEFDSLDLASINVPLNRADLRVDPYERWEGIWAALVEAAEALTRYKQVDELLSVLAHLRGMPPAYVEWIALLSAEALRRRGYQSQAEEVVSEAGEFWATSWRVWARSKGLRDKLAIAGR